MRTIYCLAAALLLTLCRANAATEITAWVLITNTPAGLSSNLTANIGSADTRYSTNNAAATPSVTFQITNSTAATRTNLHAHLNAYPVYSAGAGSPQLVVNLNATNTSMLDFIAPLNTNITVTFGGNWAYVVYFTNTFNDSPPILAKTNAMSAMARTNAENSIVNLLAQNRSTNALPTNSTFLRNYTDTNTPQTVANKTLVNPVVTGGRWTGFTNAVGTNLLATNVIASQVAVYTGVDDAVRITNGVAIHGTVYRLLGGYYTNGVWDRPLTTNLINYGDAIRSEGTGGNSLQVGSNAQATASLAMAIGNGTIASNTSATIVGNSSYSLSGSASVFGNSSFAGNQSSAFGQGVNASGPSAAAFGAGANAGTNVGSSVFGAGATAFYNPASRHGNSVTAIGTSSRASDTNASAFGASSVSDYVDSTAIGAGSATTAANQVMVGRSTETVVVPGVLSAASQTNSVLRGTSVINGRVDFTPGSRTGLANGYNSGTILGTNVYLRMSGPSAAYTNAGFAAAVDGTFHILQFDNPGLSYTILPDSGLEVTPANRILTGTGGLVNSTNQPAMFGVLYDGSATRWRLLWIR